MRFYAVRADPNIVGKAEDGGAFGIHETWDDVKRHAWHGTEPVKAAMAANYKRFGPPAGEYSSSESALPPVSTSICIQGDHI